MDINKINAVIQPTYCNILRFILESNLIIVTFTLSVE